MPVDALPQPRIPAPAPAGADRPAQPDAVTGSLPDDATDAELMAAVDELRAQLRAVGVPDGRQWINLRQTGDGSWVITGRAS